MSRLFFLCVFTLFLSYYSSAQIPVPAKPQSQPVYLTNATVHCGNGKVLSRATVGWENGKITFLEENAVFKSDQTMGRVIDGTGKHVYPAIIAMNTRMGLDEIESVRATNDYQEVGLFNPNARAVIAYNTDSRVTPTVRSNGILYAQICPQGGHVSGTSALVQLDAWNWEDAAVISDEGIFVNWPAMYRSRGWWADPQGFENNKEYEKQVKEIKDFFLEAKSYAYAPNTKMNLRLEAMTPLFKGGKQAYIRVDYIKEIEHALAFAREIGLKIVLVGAADSYLMAEELAAEKVSVVLGKTHALPTYPDEDVEQAYKTPAVLQKAGVQFALSVPDGFWQERNLTFQAGSAAAHGLTQEEALTSITLSPARIMGVDKRIGSVEKGKEASLIVTDGDILDMKSSDVRYAFIQGREIDLDNKQKMLFEKYSRKYGLK